MRAFIRRWPFSSLYIALATVMYLGPLPYPGDRAAPLWTIVVLWPAEVGYAMWTRFIIVEGDPWDLSRHAAFLLGFPLALLVDHVIRRLRVRRAGEASVPRSA